MNLDEATMTSSGLLLNTVHDSFGAAAVGVFRPDEPTDLVVYEECWGENVYQLDPDHVKGKVVLDIGANIGAFSLWAAVHGARRVVSVEPERGNLVVLREVHARAGLDRWEILPFAVGATAGTVSMDKTGGGAQSTPGGDIEQQPIAALLEAIEPDVVKIDIEGAEHEILPAGDWSKVGRIVAEWHAYQATWEGHIKATVGALVDALVGTHRVTVFGQVADGGQLEAIRYGS